MDMTKLWDFLKGKGIHVNVNEETQTIEIEEREVNLNNSIPASALTADDIAALKSIAALAPKLNAQTLDTLAQVGQVATFVQNAEDQRKAERNSLIATIKANSANVYSDDELGNLPDTVLQKMAGQMYVNYAATAPAQALLGNENVLVVPTPLTSIKTTEK